MFIAIMLWSHCANHQLRFGVSLDRRLLETFDRRIRVCSYTNRSEALRDLIRDDFVGQEWDHDRETVGTVTFVYDHHARDLTGRLIDIQRERQGRILSVCMCLSTTAIV